jgi:chromosome segregation ATPase
VRELEAELERAAHDGRERENRVRTELEARRGELQSRLEASETCGSELQRSLAALGEELAGRERALEELRVRLEASERLCEERAREREKSEKREQALDERLEKERERVEAGARALAAQQASEDGLRHELADLKKQLATLGASHRTQQLKGDRLAKQIEDLERLVDEGKGALQVARDELREREVRIKALEKDLARAERAAADEKRKLVNVQDKLARREAALATTKNKRPRRP